MMESYYSYEPQYKKKQQCILHACSINTMFSKFVNA